MKFINLNSILRKFSYSLIILSIISLSLAHRRMKTSQVNFNRSTPANDWGRNNIFYLDRHDVACNQNESLQGFKLTRPNGGLLSYSYACRSDDYAVSTQTYQTETGWNWTAGNKSRSANYLDRHNVQCQNGYALQQFRLGRNGDYINYRFRCVRVECENYQSTQTGRTADGGHETIYLDRQDVRLRGNEVMTGFKLNSNGGYWYTVNYCTLKPRPAPVQAPTPAPLPARVITPAPAPVPVPAPAQVPVVPAPAQVPAPAIATDVEQHSPIDQNKKDVMERNENTRRK
jgi:hypothetical protein